MSKSNDSGPIPAQQPGMSGIGLPPGESSSRRQETVFYPRLSNLYPIPSSRALPNPERTLEEQRQLWPGFPTQARYPGCPGFPSPERYRLAHRAALVAPVASRSRWCTGGVPRRMYRQGSTPGYTGQGSAPPAEGGFLVILHPRDQNNPVLDHFLDHF